MPAEQQQHLERREAIRRLLATRTLRTQAELAEALRALGHLVTQSSVSRDLKELRVIKDPDGYRLPEADPGPADISAAEFIRGAAPAGPNLVVVHTAIGAAQRVALEVDRHQWPEVVGTLSGDDTIFVATTGRTASRRVLDRLAPAAGEARP